MFAVGSGKPQAGQQSIMGGPRPARRGPLREVLLSAMRATAPLRLPNPPSGTAAARRAIRARRAVQALGTVCVHHPLDAGRPPWRRRPGE